jgi:hypothetical protein
MTNSRLLIVCGLAALALAGCSDVRESLGLGRSSPDEFAVVDRPPLSIPPDFSLRPPKPGEPRPQQVDMTQRANDVLFNGKSGVTTDNDNVSDSEKALLNQTGGAKAESDIRQIVDREASEKVVGSEHLVQQLLWWKDDVKPGVTVDAPAESARIKDAKDKGEPINQSATPIIERDKSGWLGL